MKKISFCMAGIFLLVIFSPFAMGTDLQKKVKLVSILAGHDYDPITDLAIPVSLNNSNTIISQSFVISHPSGSISGVGVKACPVGHPGRLTVKIGTRPGKGDVVKAVIDESELTPFFETWHDVSFKPVKFRSGVTYYLSISVKKISDEFSYYKVWCTTTDKETMDPYIEWGWQKLNTANIDYGVEPATYKDGNAFDSRGNPIAELDVPFRIWTDEAVSGMLPEPGEEPLHFIKDIISEPHQNFKRDPKMVAGANEWLIDNDWTIVVPKPVDAVTRTAVSDFRRFMKVEMGVEVKLDEVGRLKDLNSYKRAILLGTKETLPQFSAKLDKSESFVVDSSPERVIVCGYDGRGILRGLIYLEDKIKFKEAPILSSFSIGKTPLYNPRITCASFYSKEELDEPESNYTDGLLSRITHCGFNAIWLYIDIQNLVKSDLFPELGADSDLKFKRINALIEKAGKYGIDVYLYLIKEPLPAAFFDHHPEVRGHKTSVFLKKGEGNVLCTSTPEGERFVTEAGKYIFEHAPLLRGAIIIAGGEGFRHCYSQGLKTTCSRCSQRQPCEVAAGMVKCLNNGIRSVKPDADLAVWLYGARGWAPEDTNDVKTITLLPKDVILLETFEKEGIIDFDGIRIPAYDYTISYLGPAERFVAQESLLKKLNRPFWVKAEHAISLEWIQTPYLPVYPRWNQRYAKIREYPSLRGIFANWSHYGFMPSLCTELFKWQTFSPVSDNNDVLSQLAKINFGENNVKRCLEAWQHFSEGIQYYPFTSSICIGSPMPKGPAHPLFFDPKYRPAHSFGRQFHSGLGYTNRLGAAYVVKRLGMMESEWNKGIDCLKEAVANAAPEKKKNLEKELGVATILRCCMRTVMNFTEFSQLTSVLHKSKDKDEIIRTARAMKQTAQRELENSTTALGVVRNDSRLGFSNSGKGESSGVRRAGIYTAKSIEKKIIQVKRVIEKEIPEYLIGKGISVKDL
ncbi:MAG: hypothetical protein PHI84_13030 [Kiritimatiellae bacterium]|nr:hypothetical protein [Kiritimatiellia bacterium]